MIFRIRSLGEPHTDKVGQDHEAKDTALNNIGSEQAHLDDGQNNGARLCPQTSPEAVESGISKLEDRVCQFDGPFILVSCVSRHLLDSYRTN